MSRQPITLAIIGTGGVGLSFINQLTTLASTRPTLPPLQIILLARSTKHLWLPSSPKLINSISSWPTELEASGTPTPPVDTLVAALTAPDAPRPLVLVDNTSTPAWGTHYPALLRAGISVVTPNKLAFAGPSDLWGSIYREARNYGSSASAATRGFAFHESTVGAGLPVLSTLVDLVETGDRVARVEGVFSGTMSFLFNAWDPVVADPGAGGARPFSAIVREAQEKGYTEPDPRDDLNGMDVARKVTILARLLGVQVADAAAIDVRGLVPDGLESPSLTAAQFLEKLAVHDEAMGKVKEDANKEGKVVRFLGSVNVATKELKVGLEKVDKDSAIAALKGSDNIFNFYTERYGTVPLIVQGAGAGGEVTAMGVLADLLKIIRIVG